MVWRLQPRHNDERDCPGFVVVSAGTHGLETVAPSE